MLLSMMVSDYGLTQWIVICQKDQRFIITIQDKDIKIWEWKIEFIVNVQNLTQ